MSKYIAHQNQALCDHLEGVAKLAETNAVKICMGKYGELLGLLHDFGKYSAEFQKYIPDALKRDDPDLVGWRIMFIIVHENENSVGKADLRHSLSFFSTSYLKY